VGGAGGSSSGKRRNRGVGAGWKGAEGWHYIAACLASETLHCGVGRTTTRVPMGAGVGGTARTGGGAGRRGGAAPRHRHRRMGRPGWCGKGVAGPLNATILYIRPPPQPPVHSHPNKDRPRDPTVGEKFFDIKRRSISLNRSSANARQLISWLGIPKASSEQLEARLL
jgi:hypothetical protein